MIGIRKAAFKPWPLALVLVVALAACGEEGRRDWGRAAPAAQPTRDPEAAYLAPPKVVTAAIQGGGVALSGSATAGASVRLGSPTGEATSVEADAAGLWRAVLAGAPEPRLFGLSMTREGRTVQAEGYVLVTPEGMVALLKAGGGSEPLSGPSDSLRILAIDYDQDGGAVISGVGRPGAGFGVRVDRVTQAEAKVDAQGRFSFSLTRPLGHGEHAVQVAGEGGEDLVRIAVSPPAALTAGPLHAERLDGAWRADWMTPGGGVQTTVLYAPGATR
ncbi:hypothetical protein G5B46_02625 [Caulobacter sp. 602-2]|uniref:Carboxypeptidase regulatory-like domain-containing protein n=1 Tax=Caulobacter sp. 602-2 TaxID=2710887 RepID=A0A6G4QS68_9CAUL|nr:hypothetical protein [Caulobacter sp. 602-2]NGM48496.1 hypothetical protein [Caulobacter sp. 602-2]